MTRWADIFSVYRDRRLLSILFLGFSSGLPLALTGSTLAVWLTESGVDMKTIGLFALVGIPYSFKFVWAPFLDRVRIPFLHSCLGRRRSWILTIQAALILALLALGMAGPPGPPWITALLAIVVAFASASQDIVIDAYRVEILQPEQYGAGAAMVQFGYRLGMLVAGAGALFVASMVSWFWVYAGMAGLLLIGSLTILVNPEPNTAPTALNVSPRSWLRDTVGGPFIDLLQRHGWTLAVIVTFVVLYKLGDALAGMMSNPFYIKLGFTKVEIASVSKVFGFIATIVGTLAGGIVVARIGIARALLVCGVLQMLANLMFAFQAMAGHQVSVLIFTIAIENLTGGMGSAAFVAYLSGLCNTAFTGTQYALLSSLAVFGRTVLASSGGWLVERLGWIDFFLFSTAACLPGLAVLVWMMRRTSLGSR
ncbi:MAG: AmpG family muropeptide MFS transporter [Alphaproteobacteria bacterium]|nr:AmpG family muropeptide MFS transporter [Alphaproteobacteria bacterium]